MLRELWGTKNVYTYGVSMGGIIAYLFISALRLTTRCPIKRPASPEPKGSVDCFEALFRHRELD